MSRGGFQERFVQEFAFLCHISTGLVALWQFLALLFSALSSASFSNSPLRRKPKLLSESCGDVYTYNFCHHMYSIHTCERIINTCRDAHINADPFHLYPDFHGAPSSRRFFLVLG